jgi:regulator of protease activity HflC (stomatin/prohibitin superfamily)
MLAAVIAIIVVSVALFVFAISRPAPVPTTLIGISIVVFLIGVVLAGGFFTLQPNEARVMVLFGNYKGTIKETGFYWANPFYSRALSTEVGLVSATKTAMKDKSDDADVTTKSVKAKVSLRQRTLNGPKLKVNDKNGNPIEIANVIVWRVVNTAKAVFDVDNYEQYVSTQSETALRHVASLYAYDNNEDEAAEQITLRSNIIEVSQALRKELSERLAPAGIAVEDARLTHLAYAPEIAQVMLRRQQAEAIIAARSKIVQGAVSMVDMAIKELDKDTDISLDDERKATMVSNLMVVLCADNDAQPVINTGSLYN